MEYFIIVKCYNTYETVLQLITRFIGSTYIIDLYKYNKTNLAKH